MEALKCGKLDVVRLLFDRRADIRQKDCVSITLSYATIDVAIGSIGDSLCALPLLA